MMSFKKSRLAAVVTVMAVLVVSLGFGLVQAQDDPERAERPSTRTETIRIGTYEHGRVVQQYHRTQQLIAFYQDLERRFMEAQEANDSQAAMQIQMEAQQLQAMEQEVMLAFNADLDRVMPGIAEEHGLHAVAPELVYSSESVEPEDISDAVIAAINEGHEVPEVEQPPVEEEADQEPETGEAQGGEEDGSEEDDSDE